jgi:zinc protease
MLLMSYPTVSLKDVKTQAALDLLDSLLTGGGGMGGRLFQELRGEQLVYYCFGVNVGGVAPGYYVLLAQTRPENVREVRDRIQRAIDRVAREGVPADEFALTKEKLLAAHAMRDAKPTQQATRAALDELYGLGYDHQRGYEQRIRQVTVEQVKELAATLLKTPLVVTTQPDQQE